MNENIIHKINNLGGNTDAVSVDKNFAENWQSISFTHYLYDKDWDVYGIDEFYSRHKELYINDEKKFYEDLLKHYFSDHELPYGQYFFRDWFFTPFKEGTNDQEEFDGLIEEDIVQKVVKVSKPDFICIFYSYGYPDHFFICTGDSEPSNPTVYSTDHEMYFDEIENEGSLDEFLDRFMTQEEFLDVVKEYLSGKPNT
ncbi:hypothetical protein [Chryseobacterium sp. SIMBA_028]|uniref:hypothetical protein n=1 Tax=Chryseobacterium sp. SIMBA_028 TaxID=3085771 RepID=UPI00397CC5D8